MKKIIMAAALAVVLGTAGSSYAVTPGAAGQPDFSKDPFLAAMQKSCSDPRFNAQAYMTYFQQHYGQDWGKYYELFMKVRDCFCKHMQHPNG
jgi:hypothetical protein